MELPITWLRRSAIAISVASLGVTMIASEPFAQTPSKSSPKSAPSVGGVQPTLLGQYGAWGAYTASPGGRKICFALARPTSSQTDPPNRPRDPAYAFVSTRPAEKVRNEVSFTMGYGIKPGSEASAEIGNASFAMYTQGDGIWIKNAAEEERLIEAMRKGADVTVKGVSARGAETTDVYSLRGVSQALDRVAQDCK